MLTRLEGSNKAHFYLHPLLHKEGCGNWDRDLIPTAEVRHALYTVSPLGALLYIPTWVDPHILRVRVYLSKLRSRGVENKTSQAYQKRGTVMCALLLWPTLPPNLASGKTAGLTQSRAWLPVE